MIVDISKQLNKVTHAVELLYVRHTLERVNKYDLVEDDKFQSVSIEIKGSFRAN